MPEIRITTDFEELRADLEKMRVSVPDLLNDTIHEFGHAVFHQSQVNLTESRESHGTLIHSGFHDFSQQNTSVVGYTAKHAAAQEYGSKPHLIVPGAKGFLAWRPLVGRFRSFGKSNTRKVYGEWVFTKKPVHHPGNPPKAYMRNAIAYGFLHLRDIAGRVFDKYITRALKE